MSTTPRIATSIDDLEVGQRVHWYTEHYVGNDRHSEAGIIAESRYGHGFDINYYSISGWDHVELGKGVWTILEDAPQPEPEVDHTTLNLMSAVEILRVSLAAYDGRHMPLFGHFDRDRPLGLAALPEVLEAARNAVRRYDDAMVEVRADVAEARA